MAGSHNNNEAVKKLLENLQSDLKNISLETKKKYPSVKESAEEAIVKIRNASGASSNTPLAYLSNQILYPLVQVKKSSIHSLIENLFYVCIRVARQKT